MQPYRVCDAAWSEHHGHNNENEKDSQRSRVPGAAVATAGVPPPRRRVPALAW